MESINFLMPLHGTSTKTFIQNEFGEWEVKSGYKAGKLFNGFECPVESIEDAFDLLDENQNHNCFMIHGAFIENTDLQGMHRRSRDRNDGVKPTITNRKINFFCIDVDGYPGTIAELIHNELPEEFHTADYIYQYSSSYGLTDDTDILKCHLFFWLETAVMNTALHDWLTTMKKKVPALDPAPLRAAQPLYIQRRICEGAEDPIETILGLIKKDGPLRWEPPYFNRVTEGNRTTAAQESNDYDMGKAISSIMCADNYHDAIRSTALSMINRKIPANTVKALLKGAMEAAPLQDRRWQDRYDDIDRAVDSASDIVDEITIEEFEAWAAEVDRLTLETDFAGKCLKFNPLEQNIAFNLVHRLTGHGLRDIRAQFKLAKEEYLEEMERLTREAKSEERKQMGIHEILYTVEGFTSACRQARKVLAKSEREPKVFMNGTGLVSVVYDQPKTVTQCKKFDELKGDYPPMPIIRQYKKPFSLLEERLLEDVIFVNEAGKDILPPGNVLNIIGEGDTNVFKPLSGIVEHPFIDKEWRLVQKNGYNERTGLFTVLHDKLVPSKMCPKKAYKYLTDVVFDEFPFQSDLDKAVAVAALCTAVQKPTISDNTGLPGFGIVSPMQSSGKTTLAQLISYSVYNRPVAAQSWTDDDEELGKHLLGIFQEGHSCVLFDNIRQGSSITNDRLATAMTNDMFSGRQLGENKTIKVASSVVWLFTGNGISFVGDFATRVYPININPKMESPDTRNFKRDDVCQWAMDNRKHILSAVLSIVASGKTLPEMKTSSRFKTWDKFVRIPIFHASGIDLNDAVKQNQKDDPDKVTKNNVIFQLYEVFGDKEFTSKDILTKAFGSFESGDTDLGDALVDALDKRAKSTKSVGRYMMTLIDGIFEDLTLTKKTSRQVKWRILNINEGGA